MPNVRTWWFRVGPVCAIAALCMAQVAPPEGEHAALRRFAEEDRDHPPPNGCVLFVGSSTIERWGWNDALKNAFPGVCTIDRGVSGTNYGFLNSHIDELVFPYHPSKIVVYSGDNDTQEGIRPDQIAEHAQTFVDRIHERMPRVPVLVISIKPSPHLVRAGFLEHARKANGDLLQLTSTRPWLTFVNVFDRMLTPEGATRPELFVEGGLHMNEQGYAIWRQTLLPYLRASRGTGRAAR